MIAVTLFILCLLKRRSKAVLFITMVGLCFLMSHCVESFDSNNYVNEYNNISLSNSAKEPLYVLIVYFFKSLGLTYEMYHLLSSAIVIVIIGFSVYKLAKNYNLVLGLFLIYPFPLYCVTIRNCFAFSIFMIGIVFLHKKSESENDSSWFKRNRYELVYVFFVICASLIHSVYIIVLVYLVAVKLSINKTILVTAIIIVVESIVLNETVLLEFAELFNIRDRLEYALYVQSVRGQSDIRFRILVTAVIYICCFVYLLYGKKHDVDSCNDQSVYHHNQLALKLNIVCLVILPIIPLTQEIYRIQEALMLYNFVVITNNMDNQLTWSKDTLRNCMVIVSLLMIILLDDYLYVLRFSEMRRNVIDSVFK